MNSDKEKIDWFLTLIPFFTIAALAIVLFIFPEQSNLFIDKIRFFFGDTLGSIYLLFGIGALAVSLVMSFSKYGDIVLGDKNEKPRYSFFTWGCMMFTCGLAADILFYSFCEWIMYASNPHLEELGSIWDWAGVFPIYHWSFIPWAFYLVMAVAFGFMIHTRKKTRLRYSEACRPILGTQTDKLPGRVIDLFALFALLAGTATTFSIATPLMADIIVQITGISTDRAVITIIILIITCIVYTYALLHGIKGIHLLAKICIVLFWGILLLVLTLGGQTGFILEYGLQSLGLMIQHFIELSTYTDPARKTSFAQDWTIYYWAYWMVWCIAAPIFIGNISRGRTIRQIVLGGYLFGVSSTIVSFVILGNYSLGLQVSGQADFLLIYNKTGDLYDVIISIIHSLPVPGLFMILILICMITFYATSFDSIAYTAACYSYRHLSADKKPHRGIELLWCILLITLPVALVFSDSSLSNLQSVSIVSAFPIGLIMTVIVWSFFKDASLYISEHKQADR